MSSGGFRIDEILITGMYAFLIMIDNSATRLLLTLESAVRLQEMYTLTLEQVKVNQRN